MSWKFVLELSSQRQRIAGSEEELIRAISQGADLRIGTEFRHNEHIDLKSSDPDLIREFMNFDITYLLEKRWAAGICTRRQPVIPPGDLGPRPSLSLFMYNQNGQQAVARLYLDGPPATGKPGPSACDYAPDMPKYHQHDSWDAQTNAPSQNFIYDFECYRYVVDQRWRQVLHHGPDGEVLAGSLKELVDAVDRGADVKVAVAGACDDLAPGGKAIEHEVFVGTLATYYYTTRKLFIAATHPLVRVRPAVPLAYTSRGWDLAWLLVRNDGHVASVRYDPYTLVPRMEPMRCGIRWFVD